MNWGLGKNPKPRSHPLTLEAFLDSLWCANRLKIGPHPCPSPAGGRGVFRQPLRPYRVSTITSETSHGKTRKDTEKEIIFRVFPCFSVAKILTFGWSGDHGGRYPLSRKSPEQAPFVNSGRMKHQQASGLVLSHSGSDQPIQRLLQAIL